MLNSKFDIDNCFKYIIIPEYAEIGESKLLYDETYYYELAPKLSILLGLKDKNTKEEEMKYFIEEYYKQVLFKLDPQQVYNKLDSSIVIYHNKFVSNIISSWFKLFLGKDIHEYNSVLKNEEVINYLEKVIKKNIDMHGFKTLGALYLYEQGNKYDVLAKNLEKDNKNASYAKQLAEYYWCDANEFEVQYKHKRKNKKKES